MAREFLDSKGIEDARLEAEHLVAHALGHDRLQLFLDLDRPLLRGEIDSARELLVRRSRREPSAYITGLREFYSRDFRVGPGVLIPRPESEHLVDAARGWVASRAKNSAQAPDSQSPSEAQTGAGDGDQLQADAESISPQVQVPAAARIRLERERISDSLVIADFGTGSGCLAVTLALELPKARVLAMDISDDALGYARSNADELGAKVEWLKTDKPEALLELEPAGVDLLISNPPYVNESERAVMLPEVLDYEPHLALFTPGGAPNYWLEYLCDKFTRLVKPGGALMVELGYDQGDAARALCAQHGLEARIEKDLAGIERVLIAQAKRAT